MASDIYRAAEVAKTPDIAPQKEGDKVSVPTEDSIPVPHTEYSKEHNHPFTVDYFKLGETWQDSAGGFQEEVDSIEAYMKSQIDLGRIDNSTEAVKSKLDKIYKMCGIDKSERVTMQIEKLSAYIDFLNKTDHITLNHQRYGR